MECRRADGLLSGLIDHELWPLSRLRVTRHLARCAACAGKVEELRAVQAAIRTKLPYHRAPPGLAARIGAALPREAAPQAARPWFRLPAFSLAGTGLAGTSWFNRNHFGFAPPQSMFGGTGLNSDVLGTFTVLLIPVQVLLIVFAMIAFNQGWNVEMEVPKDKAKRKDREKGSQSSSSAEPATA